MTVQGRAVEALRGGRAVARNGPEQGSGSGKRSISQVRHPRSSVGAATLRRVLTLADHQITASHALAHLRRYATTVPATIEYYDYAGDLDHLPQPEDGVAMADIARLVVINARLSANDVPRLLAPIPQTLWDAVPHDARFEDLPDNSLDHPTYKALDALYKFYDDRPGLGRTKVTKMLHLKRPRLVPVIDSVAERAYTPKATEIAREFGADRPLYWAAMWRDARSNTDEIINVTQALRDDGDKAAKVADLAPLRLHDILVWAHCNSRKGCTLSG